MRLQLIKSLAIIAVLFITSCQNKEDVKSYPDNKSSYFEGQLLGERVMYPQNVPLELFNQSNQQFIDYIKKTYYSIKNAREAKANTLSYKEATVIFEKYRSKIPNLDPYSLTDKDLTRIHKDFPDIHTREDVFKKADVIFVYYNSLFKAEVLPELMETKRKKGNARIASTPLSRMNPHEESIVFNNSLYALEYLYAAQWAESTAGYYAKDEGGEDNKWDGMRHAIWNAKIIRNCVGDGAAEWRAVGFAHEATSAHEWNAEGTAPSYTEKNAMDLHNNIVGRTWMRANTHWGVFGVRNMPSDDGIREHFAYVANNATVLILTGPNAATTIANRIPNGWTALYGNAWWDAVAGGQPLIILL